MRAGFGWVRMLSVSSPMGIAWSCAPARCGLSATTNAKMRANLVVIAIASIKTIPDTEETPRALVGTEYVGRVESETIRVFGRDDGLAVAVRLHQLVKRVMRSGDD